MIPFILHWPSLFFSKVNNSQKKVLIIPGLYFPNYCVAYLPRGISRDFYKCEHVNLTQEWTRAVFQELYYTANNQKIADKKKADYQEGLEQNRADCSKKPWQLHERPGVKLCTKLRKLLKESGKESCWHCSTKPWKLQERLGEQSRW